MTLELFGEADIRAMLGEPVTLGDLIARLQEIAAEIGADAAVEIDAGERQACLTVSQPGRLRFVDLPLKGA